MCSCFVSSASIFTPRLFLDLLFPVIPCHLFVGSHCYCYSSDKRLRLLLPGLGLAACPPLVVDLLLRFPCCSILGSCHPALVVLVASKFNRSLVWGTRTNSACKRSAGATPIFGPYSWTPTTASQSRGILYHPPGSDSRSRASALPGPSAPRYLPAICSLDLIATVIRPIKGCGYCFPVWV